MAEEMIQGNRDIIEGEECPFCHHKTLTLMEELREIPFFGLCHIFSMDCSSCNYHKADLEAEEKKEPVKYTVEISSEDDLKIRIIKSAEAIVKIPHIITITPGDASNGYITNVEGIINRVKKQIEFARDEDEDPAVKKKSKNLLKKINKVLWGQDKLKIILEDPSGNSAIISEKAEKKKL
jgi:zinc finger protein